MRCIGRTKTFSRCKRNAGRLFCHQHRRQPWFTLLFVLTLAATAGGIYRDIIEPHLVPNEALDNVDRLSAASPTPKGNKAILPFPPQATEEIYYFDDPVSHGEFHFPGWARNSPKVPDDCEHATSGGVRVGIDAFAVCSGDSIFEPWIELYRPGARYHKRFPFIQDARWETVFPAYESALVGTYQVGSGGFLTITILMWTGNDYRDLTNWTDPDVYYATFALLDVAGDSWKEVVIRTGKFPSEIDFRVLGFDSGLLEFLEWSDDDPRQKRVQQVVSDACAANETVHDALCYESVH